MQRCVLRGVRSTFYAVRFTQYVLRSTQLSYYLHRTGLTN